MAVLSEGAFAWPLADRISDQIVDVINHEITLMKESQRWEATALLGGQLLALKALEKTLPSAMPAEFMQLYEAVDNCLEALMRARGAKKKHG